MICESVGPRFQGKPGTTRGRRRRISLRGDFVLIKSSVHFSSMSTSTHLYLQSLLCKLCPHQRPLSLPFSLFSHRTYSLSLSFFGCLSFSYSPFVSSFCPGAIPLFLNYILPPTPFHGVPLFPLLVFLYALIFSLFFPHFCFSIGRKRRPSFQLSLTISDFILTAVTQKGHPSRASLDHYSFRLNIDCSLFVPVLVRCVFVYYHAIRFLTTAACGTAHPQSGIHFDLDYNCCQVIFTLAFAPG